MCVERFFIDKMKGKNRERPVEGFYSDRAFSGYCHHCDTAGDIDAGTSAD